MDLNSYLNQGLGERSRIYTINMEVTGLCNARCTYCHFYLKHDRKTVAYHMPMAQFRDYCAFVRHWAEASGGETSYRFSGGDPITLKDDLFSWASLAHEISGLRPFLLTHGRHLTDEWFRKAADSAFDAIYFSVENPICPDPGAQDPGRTIGYMEKYGSGPVPIRLGVCVVPNEQFKDLPKICDWFYERVGYIPPIAEINYGAYKSPTEQQWLELERSLGEVLEKYYGRVHLNLFHSVSPELAYDGADPYVFSLDLVNRFGVTSENILEKAFEVARDLKKSNYPFLDCAQACPWSSFCVNTKWYWQGDDSNPRKLKVRDYCRFKRILNDVYYRNVVDPRHESTTCSFGVALGRPQHNTAAAAGDQGYEVS